MTNDRKILKQFCDELELSKSLDVYDKWIENCYDIKFSKRFKVISVSHDGITIKAI